VHRYLSRIALAALLMASPALGQSTNDPFTQPIEATADVIRVNIVEFATIPDIDGTAARMMTAMDEPGTERIFVSDMRGPIYSVSYDGETVVEYVDVNEERWGVSVQSGGRERGIQSFTFHPQFNQQGAPGYGKFYTWVDSQNMEPAPDFTSGGDGDSHDTVLFEWTAGNPAAATYDGAAPRELLRLQQPFPNHNGGHIAFRTTAEPGDDDYGLLYIGVGDGGSGGDPLGAGQNLGVAFGKVLRIDPLGSNSANGKYGIPGNNPFVNTAGALGEIYAYGLRNPQKFTWDPNNDNMFLADIGQNTVEKLSLVTAGANLGWNTWEGSFQFESSRSVNTANARSDESVTYPIAEYDQQDPLIQNSSAATGVYVYRSDEIPQLANLVLWGDMPSGEVFYLPADDLPEGGQAPIRRVLFNDDGTGKTFLQLIQEKNAEQGKEPASRADMRLGYGPDGQVLLLNKYDGVLRMLVP
jgi:hypothetical protein